jgi:hypothetical protein
VLRGFDRGVGEQQGAQPVLAIWPPVRTARGSHESIEFRTIGGRVTFQEERQHRVGAEPRAVGGSTVVGSTLPARNKPPAPCASIRWS